MVKNSLLCTLILTGGLLLSGCTPNAVEPPQYPSYHWPSGEEDVDMSDLDTTLTESEMKMQESVEMKVPRIDFPTSEYLHLARSGKGTITGSIYVKEGDKVVPGMSTRLYLNPVTSYSRQWYEESYLGGRKMQKADNRLFNYLRFTASDNEGNFAFYGVPSGNYYLIGTVKCGSECGFANEKNIRIARRVVIQGNQVLERDLNRVLE